MYTLYIKIRDMHCIRYDSYYFRGITCIIYIYIYIFMPTYTNKFNLSLIIQITMGIFKKYFSFRIPFSLVCLYRERTRFLILCSR